MRSPNREMVAAASFVIGVSLVGQAITYGLPHPHPGWALLLVLGSALILLWHLLTFRE